jgi:hypothetical protein
MLPPEYRTAELTDAFESLGGNLERTTALDDDGLRLLSRYVQLFNYMELNLRRSVAAFAHAGLLPHLTEKKLRNLRPASLCATVKAAIERTSASREERDHWAQNIDAIETGRSYRNLFAHWAARGLGLADIVFLTRSEMDAEEATGQPLALGSVAIAILHRASVGDLIDRMAPLEIWLAHATVKWSADYLPDDAK